MLKQPQDRDLSLWIGVMIGTVIGVVALILLFGCQ